MSSSKQYPNGYQITRVVGKKKTFNVKKELPFIPTELWWIIYEFKYRLERRGLQLKINPMLRDIWKVLINDTRGYTHNNTGERGGYIRPAVAGGLMYGYCDLGWGEQGHYSTESGFVWVSSYPREESGYLCYNGMRKHNILKDYPHTCDRVMRNIRPKRYYAQAVKWVENNWDSDEEEAMDCR